MAKLQNKIPPRAWELCRTRIAEILADELVYQCNVNGEDLSPSITIERFGFDMNETEIVNVAFVQGKPENKDISGADGSYLYNIDVYAKAKTTDAAGGDQISMLNLQRVLGLIESILDHPTYKTLGFAAPYIARVWLGETNVAEPGKNDMKNIMMGRVQFNVLVFEKHRLTVPRVADGFESQMLIDYTTKGYKFINEDY